MVILLIKRVHLQNASQFTNNGCFCKDIKALFKGDKRYKVTILNESEMKKKNAALLGVGQGSKYPSYLVDIEYNGGAGDHVALVGKGVMFDTGISISLQAE